MTPSKTVVINWLLGHCLATPTTVVALHETGTLHTTWRYSDQITV